MGQTQHDTVRAIEWSDDGLRLLDQRRLPDHEEYRMLRSAADTADAIAQMTVRGAPAIGITAAYGVVLAVREQTAAARDGWRRRIGPALDRLAAARPTAVNLFWALERMRAAIARCGDEPVAELLVEARRIHAEDIAANRRMGELGATMLERGSGVLTHCNTGSLATGGYGTALGVIRSGISEGRIDRVFADETRPWLQGARLTSWELARDGIPVTLLVDGAAAALMHTGKVQWVIVGADRIAANGDTANKIGTYSAAIAARHHGVRFMVVAPTSTIDTTIPDGGAIPIETRDPAEVLTAGGKDIAAAGARAWNPVFDVTPAPLIDAIVTELGVVHRPDAGKMARLMARASRTPI